MEKDQFVAADKAPWWLLERDVDYRIGELRRKLGAAFGWTDLAWYLEGVKLEQVYEFILTQPRVLLDELDLAADDELRARWLESVIELNTPAAAVPATTPPTRWSASAPSAVPAERRTPGSAHRQSAFGSRPLAGPGDAGNRTGGAWTDAVSPRRSAFGSPARAEPEAAADRGREARRAAPTSSEPPRRSPFGPRAPAAAARRDAGPSSLAPRRPAPIGEQVQTVISALSTDELSAMADQLEIRPRDVEAMLREDDFPRLVAQVLSQLAPAEEPAP